MLRVRCVLVNVRLSMVTKLYFTKGKKLLLMCGFVDQICCCVRVLCAASEELRRISLFRRMLTVRSGFPCKCVPSQFQWVIRASCVHRMVTGTMCVDRCFLAGILLMHTWASTVWLRAVVFSCMWLHPSCSGCRGASGHRWLRTLVRRSKSDANSQEAHVCANTGGHVCD